VSLDSGFRVLNSAMGMYLVSFCVATKFYSICNVLFCVAFSCREWNFRFSVNYSIEYFVLCDITQILIIFYVFVSIFIFVILNMLCLIQLYN
jgi:hypothetical protein